MNAVCDVTGCNHIAGMIVRGYALCPTHGDAVIDRLREKGLSTRHVDTVAVSNIIRGLAAALGPPIKGT